MKSPKSLYSRLALITSVTLVIGYFVVYAAWTNLSLLDVESGDTITTSLMQSIVNKINDIGGRTDGIYSSAGNIGIGTASPTTKLHIDGGVFKISNSTVNSASIEMRGGLDGGYSSSIYIRSSTGGYNTMLSDGTYNNYIGVLGGYVGIGTASPVQKLDVVGNIKTSGSVFMGYQRFAIECSNVTSCSVTCPSGKKVLGGGCVRVVGGANNLQDAFPSDDTIFTCTWATAPTTSRVYATCARIDN